MMNNVKEEQTKLRAQNEKVEECKNKPRSWINNIPAKHQFLEPIKEDSKSNKHAKNDIVSN